MSSSVCSKPSVGVPSWKKDGLRFECQPDCTDCCNGPPDSGVWLTKEELPRLADALNMPEALFRAKHTRQLGTSVALMMGADNKCPLLEDSGCKAYDARPLQCQTFPFWPAYIQTAGAWEQAKARCPGAGKGPVHSIEDIRARLKALRIAHGLKRLALPPADAGV